MAITEQTRRTYGKLLVISYVEDFQNKIFIQVYADGVGRMERVGALSRSFPASEREAAAAWYAGIMKEGLRAAPLPQERRVRVTRSQVFRQPLSPRQERYIAWAKAENDGILTLNRVSSWLSLQAIADKTGAEIIERERTGKILAIRVS